MASFYRSLAATVLLLASVICAPAHAQLSIEISGVGASQIPIAVCTRPVTPGAISSTSVSTRRTVGPQWGQKRNSAIRGHTTSIGASISTRLRRRRPLLKRTVDL